MPVAAQGLQKVLSYKKQSGLGVPASGGSGQQLRRRTSVWTKPIATYDSDEILSHQQSMGVGIGPATPQGKIDALLSPQTYSDLLASLVRRNFAAITPSSGLSITIAGAGPTYTVTRSAGSWLTDGVKAGYVGRLTAGAFNAANLNKNLLVVAVTSATVLTVKPVNGVALVAEGPIATSTFTVTGKTTYAPTTGQTVDYYTVEEYYADLGKGETFTDTQVVKADLSVPASGNVGLSLALKALQRTLNASQILTSPTAATGTGLLAGVNGVVMANGAVIGTITAASISIDAQANHTDATLGSTVSDDIQRGVIKVMGSLSIKFDGTAYQVIKDAGTVTSATIVITTDQTAAADFVGFTVPAIKLTSDDPDDGMKQVIRTYAFEAQYNSTGGAGTSSEQSIIAIQDSLAN